MVKLAVRAAMLQPGVMNASDYYHTSCNILSGITVLSHSKLNVIGCAIHVIRDK